MGTGDISVAATIAVVAVMLVPLPLRIMAPAVVTVVPVISIGVNLSAFQFVAVIVSFTAIGRVAATAGSCRPPLLLVVAVLLLSPA